MTRVAFRAAVLATLFGWATATAAEIPRPEHPTPDAVRPHWANLNGKWQFRFDPKDEGLKAGWEKPGAEGFDKSIVVPFPWESELSGVTDPKYHGVAWYRREFTVPAEFPKNDHVWLRFGAVDWRADVWVNGEHVARHEGGYTPFEADVTKALKAGDGKAATVVVRVFDPTDPGQPTGKQVGWYTSTSGIWQTVWLEARPKTRIDHWATTTKINPANVTFDVTLADVTEGKYVFSVRSDDPGLVLKDVSSTFEISADELSKDRSHTLKFSFPAADAKLWTPENPHLYDVTLELKSPGGATDAVKTYFGLRTIARGTYGDEPFERILLNGKPIYLRTALDQSFNPKGVYTAPDDDFLKRDLLIAKYNGLNGLRIHIKPDEPRRLYWADKLGLLILEDMPNTWQQNAEARKGWEATMREAVARDINHPSIITWVAFNETWGLVTGDSAKYKVDKDTQQWVSRMVGEIRKLDSSRLVEDNSPCNYDHVENTDLNSWHFYIDDHAEASRHVNDVVARTHPGSEFNFCPGQKQGTAPLINSEYGGVGAGNGDRDVSWCFRDLTTILRRQPKIQGYVYTELTDIEWEHNGFFNYDRTPKEFGYGAFVPDMRPNELNGADFIGFTGPPALVVKPGEKVTVPVFISHYSDLKGSPKIRWWVSGWDDNADHNNVTMPETLPGVWTEYGVRDQAPLTFTAPKRPFVGSVNLVLRDKNNTRIAANFVNLVVKPDPPLPAAERLKDREAALRFAPGDFSRSHWSGKSTIVEGKAYGEGKGYLEYKIKVPEAVVKAHPESLLLRFEIGSRAGRAKIDWDDRVSPEDYPQTDTRKWPSTLAVSINGKAVHREKIDDDPADSRGVLSHLARFEPGSYGQLVEAEVKLTSGPIADALAEGQPLTLRLSVPDDAEHAGGLSLYGSQTGQYPFDPTVIVVTKDPLASDLGVKPDQSVALDRMSDRRTVALATGESGKPSEWSYTTADPGPAWTRPDFDAKGWARGKSAFGTGETPSVRVHSDWKTERIWLQTTVDLPEVGNDDVLTLRIFHDEDAEVFVNGKRLLQTHGYINAYRDVELDAAKKVLFHEGKNTIAVSCRQTSGGQGIDVGLTLLRAE